MKLIGHGVGKVMQRLELWLEPQLWFGNDSIHEAFNHWDHVVSLHLEALLVLYTISIFLLFLHHADNLVKQLFVYFIKSIIGETSDILGVFLIKLLTKRYSPWEKRIGQLNPQQKRTYQKYSKFYLLAECFLHSAYHYMFIPCVSKNFYSFRKLTMLF